MALSPAVVGAIAGAVAGGATTVFFQSLLRWGQRCMIWVRDRFAADHQSLFGGSWAYNLPPDAGVADVRVLAICAPSRTLRRPHIDVDRAIAFVHHHVPGSFRPDPTYSNVLDGVRFANPTPSGLDDGHALVAANGRLSLSLPVPTAESDDGPVLDVVALLGPITAMARAAADPNYHRLFRVRRTLLPRRFDWRIGVSTTSHGLNGTQLAWEALTFPGRRPRRASEQRPFCPADGHAAGALRSRRSTEPIEDLLSRFLVSFLECNGYHDFGDAIGDVLVAWRAL